MVRSLKFVLKEGGLLVWEDTERTEPIKDGVEKGPIKNKNGV